VKREITVTFKTDNGFLRRKCPSCLREFKWFHTEVPQYPKAGPYHCPYCGGQADEWLTDAQRRYMQKIVGNEATKEVQQVLKKALNGVNRSGGMIRVTHSPSRPPSRPIAPSEPADMREVKPPCHPLEPLKIAEDWNEPVHCLVCGGQFTSEA
jgi:hypothetical protein